MHRQGVHLHEQVQGELVRGEGLLEQVLLEEIRTPEEVLEVRRQPLPGKRLDRPGPGALLEVHAVRVAPVAAVPVLPGHRRVVPEAVEPRTDQGVAALHLVVEEAERQGAVHGLDPERQAAKLHRQRVEVHGVDAALHHVAAEHRLQARLEALVVRRAGDQLVGEAEIGGGARTGVRRARAFAVRRGSEYSLGRDGRDACVPGKVVSPVPDRGGPSRVRRSAVRLSRFLTSRSAAPQAEQPHQGALAVGLDAAVMLERGVERIGEEAKRGEGKGAGAAGGVAHRQCEDLLGKLRRPACGGRIRVGRPVRTGRRIVGERAQGALDGGDGESRAGVEAPRALAGAAPAHQVPLAGEDDAGDELLRLGTEPCVELAAALRGVPAAGLPHEAGHLRRTACPSLRPGAALPPLVRSGHEVLRRRFADFERQWLALGVFVGLVGLVGLARLVRSVRPIRASHPARPVRPAHSTRSARSARSPHSTRSSRRTDPRRRVPAANHPLPQAGPATHRKARPPLRPPGPHRPPTRSPSSARTAS